MLPNGRVKLTKIYDFHEHFTTLRTTKLQSIVNHVETNFSKKMLTLINQAISVSLYAWPVFRALQYYTNLSILNGDPDFLLLWFM